MIPQGINYKKFFYFWTEKFTNSPYAVPKSFLKYKHTQQELKELFKPSEELYFRRYFIMIRLKKSKTFKSLVMALAIVAAVPTMAFAHCDTVDGPTVGDAKKAIETNNVNYVLKWVAPENEEDIRKVFDLAMKARKDGPEAQELADNYLFENLVRIHRAGEGAPFTGVKPSGTAIDEVVLAADKSIEVGNLSPLEGLIPKEKMPELEERFEKAMALKDYDVNDVEAGREYIEAYVSYFKFAEGEEDHHHGEEAHYTEEAHHTEEVYGSNDSHEAEVVSNPKTGDVGVLPFVAMSAISGAGALALALKKKIK